MSDLNAMVKATLTDLDAAGALADLLQELGRDREAVLLRRRWKAWQRDRANAPQEASEVYREFAVSYAPDELLHEPFRLEDFCEGFVRGVDGQFHDYIARRFVASAVSSWVTIHRIGHAVAASTGLHGITHLACGAMYYGCDPVADEPQRKCRQCLRRLGRQKPTEVAA